MDRQTLDLGFILRQFKNYKFSMDKFDDRHRLQKFIYLLQAHDIYLGYDYSWYLRGPYCTTLAKRGFVLDSIYKSIPSSAKSVFVDPDIREKFNKFKKFIKGKEMDINYLEILASLHILKMEGLKRDKAVEIVYTKKPDIFVKELCCKIWDNDMQKLSPKVKMKDPPGIISSKAYPLKTKIASTTISSTHTQSNDLDDDLDKTQDMIDKPVDLATYYMIKDATTDKDFHLVGNNMFRSNEQKPTIDMLMIDNDIVTKLIMRGKL